MKAKHLIKDYTVRKSACFQTIKPDVTIVMSTHSRAKNNLFKRVVESIQKQNLKNYELIIVYYENENITDELIQSFMDTDDRITSIRYDKKNDIPAISANLGIEHASADKIIFINEDNEFLPDGLLDLYEYQIENDALVCYGKTKYLSNIGDVYWLGDKKVDSRSIKYNNYIASNAILIDKKVFEDVGLFDPHIAAVDFFDWDLWHRMMTFNFEAINTIVNIKHADALSKKMPANKYPFALEWMYIYKNNKLQISNWKEYEVIQPPLFLSYSGQQKIAKVAADSFSHLGAKVNLVKDDKVQGYVLLLGDIPVSGEIVFAVRDSSMILNLEINVFMHYAKDFLAGARCIIINRTINKTTVALTKLLYNENIPYYYYLDDFLMSPDYPALYKDSVNRKAAQYYGSRNAAMLVRNAEGVIVSTHALAEKMKAYNSNIIYMTCTTPLQVKRKHKTNLNHFYLKNNEPIRIGYFSSVSKIEYFFQLKYIFKQLQRKIQRPIELYIPCLPEQQKQTLWHFADMDNISIKQVDRENNYINFIEKAAREKLHFIIHVFNKDETDNTELYLYKTFNILLTSYLCNVIPLIPVRPPFDNLRENYETLGELIVDDEAQLLEKMIDILKDPPKSEKYNNEIKGYIEQHYPIEINQQALQKILQKHNALYDIVEKLDLSDFMIPNLLYTLPQECLGDRDLTPFAKYYDKEDKLPIVLIHCPNLSYFYRNELMCYNLPGKKVLVYFDQCNIDEINELAYKNQDINILFCKELSFVINHMVNISLIISPFVLPLEAHSSFFQVIKIAKELDIKVLGIQHGLFQLGLNQVDVSAGKLASYGPISLTIPLTPCCDYMLNWGNSKNGIGYSRNTSRYTHLEKEDYILILSNLNWHIYTHEERECFAKMIVRLAEEFPDETFIWCMHPGELVVAACHTVRQYITSAENENIFEKTHPAKTYPTEQAISCSKMVISMPSTVLLDAEVYDRPTLIYTCYANQNLNDVFERKTLFSDYRELRLAFKETLKNPDNGILKTGMLNEFNPEKFQHYVDKYVRKTPVKGICAVKYISDFFEKGIDRKLLQNINRNCGTSAPPLSREQDISIKNADTVKAAFKNDVKKVSTNFLYRSNFFSKFFVTLHYLDIIPEYIEFKIRNHCNKTYIYFYLSADIGSQVFIEWTQDKEIIEQTTVIVSNADKQIIDLPKNRKNTGFLGLRLCKVNQYDNVGVLVLPWLPKKKLIYWTT